MKRRRFLGLGVAGLGYALGDASTEGPLRGVRPRPGLPWAGLLRTCAERDEVLAVEGAWPSTLRGTLYRNGPGRYERGGEWKRSFFDGDGMVRAFHFDGGSVRYRSRYVRTQKYIDEERAGRFLQATWSTQAPGGATRNLGGLNFGYQAGITVVPQGRDLLAFDEPGQPYALDPETLATRAQTDLGFPGGVFNAHVKRIDGDLMLYGVEYGRFTRLHVAAVTAGARRWHRTFELEEAHVIHDWFVTPRWCVFLLQPVIAYAYPFLYGRKSLMGCIEWWPRLGTRIMLLPRDGRGAPRWFHHDPVFFLHTINAHEAGDEVVLDFIAYNHPSTIFGPGLQLARLAVADAVRRTPPSQALRWRVSTTSGRVQAEALPFLDCEMPIVPPAEFGRPQRSAWAVTRSVAPMLFNSVARFDFEHGTRDSFDFGPMSFVSEPACTPDGHLLVPGYDGRSDRGFLAVFRAQSVASGPLARAWLRDGANPGFHGAWHDGA